MSSYSFSHQFYQHWTLAPETIRAAIVQELTDINNLLQPDTQFEDFVFSEPDLDSHLNKLYDTYKIQQTAAKEITDKQSEQRLEEEQRAETEKTVDNQQGDEQEQQDKIEDKNKITDQISENQLSKNQNISDDANKTDDTINDNAVSADKNTKENSDKQIDAIPEDLKQNATIEHLPKTPKLSKDNEDLIHELGMHIDDYLSEQMAQMSEDLKSWLRNEIIRQLGGEQQAIENTDNKK